MGEIGLTFLGILLFLSSCFMILLILVQRGKGGGLTGALGGMGGQSAFGAKAGDVFTRITVITAIIWITLCMITIAAYNPPPRDAEMPSDAGPSIISTDDKDEMPSEPTTKGEEAKEKTPADLDAELEKALTDDSSPESADGDAAGGKDATDNGTEGTDGPTRTEDLKLDDPDKAVDPGTIDPGDTELPGAKEAGDPDKDG